MAAIDIAQVTKRFGDTVAVRALSLQVADREFVTLLGPSGCGKTTLLRLIAGFMAPDTGTIRVGTATLSTPASVVPPERRGMGMVFQNYAVWPHKSVYDNVAFGLQVRRVARAEIRVRVARVLELVNLGGLDARYPGELSGGQQQRVALARSLVVEPSILLLDEPLSNLDAKLRERMRTELKEVQRRTGITFVYVTHDQAEALALSDHVAVISGGRLQQYGTPLDVYAHPANRMVADFMGLVNLVPGKVRDVANGRGRVVAGELALDVAALDGLKPGEAVDVAIRPENIRLHTPSSAAATALASEASGQRGDSKVRAKITNHVFLGNISEYYATLPGGQVLRVQTHPLQHFAVGEEVAVEVDAAQCSVFRRE